jgi:tryptophanyl-tRNA synthetase
MNQEVAEKQIVLSGIRATGQLHLGNYLGALSRFAEMSRNPAYFGMFFVADYHTLTTLQEARLIKYHLPNIVLDYVAAGIDLSNTAIYAQSSVPQVTELTWLLSCLTPVGELTGQASFKQKSKQQPDLINAGLLIYPVLMAADILGVCANFVPVGKDQQAHLELAALVARKFNHQFGEYFPIPDALTGEMITVPGLSVPDTEGRFSKMGKSDKNTINLSDTPDEQSAKIRACPTDPQKVRKNDPGRPEVCPIFQLHKAITSAEDIQEIQTACLSGQLGCLECKARLNDHISTTIANFRARRQGLEPYKAQIVGDTLAAGKSVAAGMFRTTLEVVRDKMGLVRY